ncbi:MAG: tetratricopeptide repeat protein, partial [Pseudomonadales bacterium]|nr:tetratricopeptide repeat protein [Pseudomonadales bacterium]
IGAVEILTVRSWLVLLLLPLAAFAFRRGWLWSLALLVTVHSEPADALTWEDLWQTRDQQAMEALESGNANEAAELFEDPAWKAAAQYRAEDFSNAAERFATLDSADARYNYGNALAKQGQYEAAIEAYEEALEMNPENEDAAFNKQLLEDVLEEQQQQQNNQDQQANQNQEQQQDQQQQGSPQDQEGQGEQQEQQEPGEQQQADQKEEDNPENRQQQEEGEKAEAGQQQMAEEDAQPLDEEEQQALEQWLRRVPDDPGGLLRRKFLKQHEDRIRRGEVADNDTKDW